MSTIKEEIRQAILIYEENLDQLGSAMKLAGGVPLSMRPMPEAVQEFLLDLAMNSIKITTDYVG